MMLHTQVTKKERESEYRYFQNNFDVTVYVVHGIPLFHSQRFFKVLRIHKKTGVKDYVQV